MSEIGEISPQEAWELMQADDGATLVDVRSSMEYRYVGHPVGAVHVPWMEPPRWQPDPRFVERVSEELLAKGGGRGDMRELPVMMICRSGSRSADAAVLLARAGFGKVYNVLEGFEGERDESWHRSTINGWRFHSLPWRQD